MTYNSCGDLPMPFPELLKGGKRCEAMVTNYLLSKGYQVQDISEEKWEDGFSPFDLLITGNNINWLADVKHRRQSHLWYGERDKDRWSRYELRPEYTKIVILAFGCYGVNAKHLPIQDNRFPNQRFRYVTLSSLQTLEYDDTPGRYPEPIHKSLAVRVKDTIIL